jgi:hypothetical protein
MAGAVMRRLSGIVERHDDRQIEIVFLGGLAGALEDSRFIFKVNALGQYANRFAVSRYDRVNGISHGCSPHGNESISENPNSMSSNRSVSCDFGTSILQRTTEGNR